MQLAVQIFLILVAIGATAPLALGAWTSGKRAATSRMTVVSAVLSAVFGLALVRAVLAEPALAPAWLVLVVLAGASSGRLALRWRGLPWAMDAAKQPLRRPAPAQWLQAAFEAALAGAALFVLV